MGQSERICWSSVSNREWSSKPDKDRLTEVIMDVNVVLRTLQAQHVTSILSEYVRPVTKRDGSVQPGSLSMLQQRKRYM